MNRIALALLLLATVPAANWMIGHVGTVCPGPCLVPIGFGLMAPSGVLMIGVALVLRDALHEAGGRRWVIAAIAAGGALSATVAPPALVVASVLAFVLSELADFAVYAPLRERNRPIAVMASGVAGAVVDSALFLGLAFGSLEYMPGQVLGKLYASALVAAILAARSRCWLGHSWALDHCDGHTYAETCRRCPARRSGWNFYT